MRTPVRTVTDDHGNELTVRRCRECKAWKPADTEHFYADRGRLRGSCIPCKRTADQANRAAALSHAESRAAYVAARSETRKRWRRRNPDKVRAARRRYYEKHRQDECERSRIAYTRRTTRSRPRTAIGGYRHDRTGALPALPLQTWLKAVIAREITGPALLRDLSAVLDVDDRVIWRVRHGEHQTVTLTVADHLLTRYNRPVVIRSRDLERRLIEWAQGLPGNGGRLLAYLDQAETVAHLADVAITSIGDLYPELDA